MTWSRAPIRAHTLLDVIQAVGEVTADDREVVAVVLRLLRSGRIRLQRKSPPVAEAC